MVILAIDPATKCGWALGSNSQVLNSGTWNLATMRDESSGMKLVRLRAKLNDCRSAGVDLVVFEAARNAAPGMQGALVSTAKLQAIIEAWCIDHHINYRGYSPSEIKRHATGKGNANKSAMMAAARKRGWSPADDNEADALWLLDLAGATLAEGE